MSGKDRPDQPLAPTTQEPTGLTCAHLTHPLVKSARQCAAVEALATLSMRCMCEGDEEKRKRRQGATALLESSPIYFSFIASSARQHGVDCAVPCTVDGARISARSQPVRSAAQIRHERIALGYEPTPDTAPDAMTGAWSSDPPTTGGYGGVGRYQVICNPSLGNSIRRADEGRMA
jgi:hypothetical protein